MKNAYLLGIAVMACIHLSFTVPATHKLLPTKQSGAISFTTNETVDFSLGVYIPCADDLVLLEGKLHILTHVTLANNAIVVKSHYQPQGISGVGISGDKYQATGVTQDIFKGSMVNGQFAATSINNFRIIGQRTNNNYLVHATLHTTVNANGEVTATVDQLSVECK